MLRYTKLLKMLQMAWIILSVCELRGGTELYTLDITATVSVSLVELLGLHVLFPE